MEKKIWANSGDSHILEPEDLFQRILPPALAERMPHTEKDGGWRPSTSTARCSAARCRGRSRTASTPA